MIVNYSQQPINVKQVKEEQHGEQYHLIYINNQTKQIDKLLPNTKIILRNKSEIFVDKL